MWLFSEKQSYIMVCINHEKRYANEPKKKENPYFEPQILSWVLFWSVHFYQPPLQTKTHLQKTVIKENLMYLLLYLLSLM